MKVTTDKEGCRILVEILSEYGVKEAVLCPGARDLPLIVAFSRCEKIKTHSVVDERVAGFIALGKAEITGEPVAIVCTSGTAVLNVAPAVAEAYYKHIPLIVISADRPERWIDQLDSQTIRQKDVFRNFIKGGFTVKADLEDEEERWFVRRTVSEALISSIFGIKGPVHINVPIEIPLNTVTQVTTGTEAMKIEVAPVKKTIERDYLKSLVLKIQNTSRVLIVCGSFSPDSKLSRWLNRLSLQSNVVVLSENLSNVHVSYDLGGPDSLLAFMGKEMRAELYPEILITFGGPLVSQFLKNWLREGKGRFEHYHIEDSYSIEDTFKSLTVKFAMKPQEFFGEVVSALRTKNGSVSSSYKESWLGISNLLREAQKNFLNDVKWSDLYAINCLLGHIPSRCNMQVSNGLSVRYLMNLPGGTKFHRVDCNRGVSGIDGSTSTAVGASTEYNHETVLLSGDMSALYDIAGLLEASKRTENFKMAVFCNGGGNIFKFISSTSGVEENIKYLYNQVDVNFKSIASGNGWWVDEWTCSENSVVKDWLMRRKEPSLLIIKTDSETNAKLLKDYFALRKMD